MRLIRADAYHGDLRQIIEYISADNPAAALETIEHIERHIKQLASFPNLGRAGRIRRTRELVIAGMPYIVIYLVGDDLIIARVIHGARKWPRRLVLKKP